MARSLFNKQTAFNGTLLEIDNKIQQSCYLGCHATLCRDELNRNLHKVVYTKLEKYSAEIDNVCSRLASVFIRLICNRVRNLDTCSTLLIDVLQFIPGEARDLLRIAPRIAIDLAEGR